MDLNKIELELLEEGLSLLEDQVKSKGRSTSMGGEIAATIAAQLGGHVDGAGGVNLCNCPACKARAAESQSGRGKQIEALKSRQRQILLLRAKLCQASAVNSEHEVAPETPTQKQ